MNWIIAIPSHGRSKSINANTLKVLHDYDVPTNRIKVFVAPDEVEAYRSTILSQIEIVPSIIGCIENRAYIRQYFPEGQHIVYIDDDIKGIFSVCDQSDNHATCETMKAKNNKSPDYVKQIRLPDLCKFLTNAFNVLVLEGASFGGIYPIANGFFASHQYRTDLRYVCGGMYFEINHQDIVLQGLQYAEDFERTGLFYKRDGKLIRFEWCMLKTPYYKGDGDSGAGGLVESRTIELTRLAQLKVIEMYPGYFSLVEPTKNNKFYTLKVLKQK